SAFESSTPSRPEEKFVMRRTWSIGAWAGPQVTITRIPASYCSRADFQSIHPAGRARHPGAESPLRRLARLHVREEQDVANRFRPREHHHEPVDTDADASRRRHSVFERLEEISVEFLRLA